MLSLHGVEVVVQSVPFHGTLLELLLLRRLATRACVCKYSFLRNDVIANRD